VKIANPAALVAAIIVALPISAQLNTGEIGGSVRDPLSGPLASVTIVAQRPATGLKYTGVTNTSGEYLIAQLPPGDYVLTATADGFKKSVILVFWEEGQEKSNNSDTG
jgi:hypothetical protein